MQAGSPYHEGEIDVQRRAGEQDAARRSGAVVSDSIIVGAWKFLEQQPMALLASLDQNKRPWASALFGTPGFLSTPDGRAVDFDLAKAAVNSADPFWRDIRHDPLAGMLVIELATRRRLRVNGRLQRISPERLRLEVQEAYPNCPKYIQRRYVKLTAPGGLVSPAGVETGAELDAAAIELIRAADTFFVASAHRERGLDASHRGGRPGFIRLLDERTLEIPDYPGNSMYNTLGNFAVFPRAGLLFLDFHHGAALQLTGGAEILWDASVGGGTGGTGRCWRFTAESWLRTALPEGIEWEFVDFSPFNPAPEDVPSGP